MGGVRWDVDGEGVVGGGMWFQNVRIDEPARTLTIFSGGISYGGAFALTRLPMQEKNEKQMSNGLATTFAAVLFWEFGNNLPEIQVSPPQDHRFILLLALPTVSLLREYSNPLPSPKGKAIQFNSSDRQADAVGRRGAIRIVGEAAL
jgi:hypothetical protein